ncbi:MULTISPECIES: type VII secretion-associated protein [unclassified Mycolicibacterium]|uniref:type VII secretion-associated protein n=1 Tax=unclassified Mycolicibacterium TaxID=2636767 RepID=UPI00130AA111|nr:MULTISPECIES: type VII secretion-associated protein [unclassified Mycolicibacterium]MUL81351.1 type VII secretion-associated protein [Mycolicibacterium sp. CBMA 329]MUL87117.1 type VII secretion-associated protein [Mycolicibacterium sp. CBMA 331]MUL98601.1 type VII secretion-associated protein [Mycolicibacterium sp. CBMA 334]MUM28335.1 type VII secretion-associated protein [Mycolicibacterium sp. CBMA 295]MUM37414.1 type VII secretion-associated protein [Mycolicibacterium sp. CBMA 247]
MTTAVIEVGPVTVRGPGPVQVERAAVAVASIDDEIALVDDEPVGVTNLWAEVLDTAAAGARNLTLVCPTWWTADQRDRVRVAAAEAGAEVVVVQRVQALRSALTGGAWAVVEIADELVMVSAVDAEPVALARHADADVDPEVVVRAVIAAAGVRAEVTVDAPPEIAGAAVLGTAVAAGLRRCGAVVVMADAQTWREAFATPDAPVAEGVRMRSRPGRVAICTAAAVVLVLGGAAVAGYGDPTHDPAMTVLVEGRVGMQIPAGWTVHRVTEGPGSARVQVVSSSDPQVMIHLTQSGLGDGAVADTLQRALQEQPAGVFVDFDASAVIAARPVVSYREVRPGREIRWAVFVDGPVRIAIGCQSAQGHGEAVRSACEAATRSAHAVF